MPRSKRMRLVVDIDLAAEPVSGHLIDERGSTTDILGWLDLIGSVEDARYRASGAGRARPPQRSPRGAPTLPRGEPTR